MMTTALANLATQTFTCSKHYKGSATVTCNAGTLTATGSLHWDFSNMTGGTPSNAVLAPSATWTSCVNADAVVTAPPSANVLGNWAILAVKTSGTCYSPDYSEWDYTSTQKIYSNDAGGQLDSLMILDDNSGCGAFCALKKLHIFINLKQWMNIMFTKKVGGNLNLLT
eukprot:UN31179